MNTLKKIAFSAFIFIVSLQGFSQKIESVKATKSIQLTLVRDKQTNQYILGKLYCNGIFLAYTLERPWVHNKSEVSSIPTGEYTCSIRCSFESEKFKYKHLLVNSVPNRSHILFHVGNTVSDSHGCILTGLVRGSDYLEQSQKAHQKLMAAIGSSHNISIVLTVKTLQA